MAQNGWSTKVSGRQTYENTRMQSNTLSGKMGQYRYSSLIMFPREWHKHDGISL